MQATPILRLAQLLIAIWLGAIIAIGLLVAPALFAQLPRAQAGAIAGTLFVQLSMAACVLGPLTVILLAKAGVTVRSASSVALLLATGLAACLLLVVIPLMQGLRGTGLFMPLHALSGLMFCAQAVCLVRAQWVLR